MKQLFLNKGQVSLHDVSIPEVGENDVLVALRYSFISSGTEGATVAVSSKSLLKRFLGDVSKYSSKVSESIKENGLSGTVALVKGKSSQLMELGYSASGRVVKVGSRVEGIKVGDFVACGGSGSANHAEFVAVSENLVVKVSEEFLRQASLTTIGAIAMQGIRRADFKLGEKVCVIGLGLIGQLTAQLAKLSGCEVVGVDLDEERLKLAKTLGCDKVCLASSNYKKELDFFTEHHGVDATIITAASSSGVIINQAMEITRRKGKVVLVGDVKLDFDREQFYTKEIDFLISCSYGPGRYDNSYEKKGVDYPYSYVRWTENRNMRYFVSLIERGSLKVDTIISQEFSIDEAEKAYQALQGKKSLGLVLSYEGKEPSLSKRDVAGCMPYVKPNGKLKVGIVGAGGFAKVKLLPALKALGVDITTVIDANAANSLNVANQYGATSTGNSHLDVVGSDKVDMVLIATPHALHAGQALDCLKGGKAVFLEKPAAVTKEELSELETLFNSGNGLLFAVDFNRSFAPFNIAIKSEVEKRSAPLVVTYRMNAGYIPKEHWIQQRESGGRIIGEACHVFELFCFLTDSKPSSVTVGALQPSRDDLSSTDNLSIHIAFSDGSICSLLYTALGSNSLNKEHMEVFYDGKTIIMDDYKELSGFGLPNSFSKKTKKQDKGHEVLLKLFVEAATKNSYSPISFERICVATEISLVVDELAREGGGKVVF